MSNSTDREKPGSGKKSDDFLALLARYLPLMMIVPASVFAGYAFGYGLDYLFSTRYLRIVFLMVGIVSAFVQVIRDLSRDLK